MMRILLSHADGYMTPGLRAPAAAIAQQIGLTRHAAAKALHAWWQ